MVEGGGGASFAPEALEGPGLFVEAFGQQFERDAAAQAEASAR
jgi:hypothetical protein